MRTAHQVEVLDLEDGNSGEWERLGRELKQVDPRRYAELRLIAERIVLVHRDPDHPVFSQRTYPVITARRPKGVA